MNLSVQEIKNILKAEGTLNSNQFIDTISVDSRSLQNKENTLFFALSGPNYNAHQFIPTKSFLIFCDKLSNFFRLFQN